MANSKVFTLIAWLTGGLTILLGLFSFILSFNALADLANTHKVSIPWMFPFVVEFGMIVFSLNALWRSMQGERVIVQWTLIIGSSLLAGVFNIAHAPPALLSQTIAAMPSLFLLLSFESFLSLVKHSVKRSVSIQSLADIDKLVKAKETELSTRQQELERMVHAKRLEVEQLTRKTEQVKVNTEQKVSVNPEPVKVSTPVQVDSEEVSTPEQRRLSLVDILRQEGDIGVTKFADRLNVTRTTVYKDIDALLAEGTISRNGTGLKVKG